MPHLPRLLVAPLALLAPLAMAQEEQRQYSPWVFNAAGGVVNQFESDFSDGPGSVSVQRAFIQGGFGYAWDKKNQRFALFGRRHR